MWEVSWPATTVHLGPGDQLALFTDGVIDTVGTRARFGEDRLQAALKGATGAADAVRRVGEALDEFASGLKRDDRAMLVVRRDAGAARNGREHHRVSLPSGMHAPAEARRAVAGWLEDVLDGRLLRDVELLVSELVTNGVRHATRRDGDAVDMDVLVSDDAVRVEVRDRGPGFEVSELAPPPPGEPGGRGLLIVDRLASRWGVDTGASTCVWFEVDR
jgi:anti-sigma regulatory factor (Ser/Thr protein kinase)